ncbi:endonuclease VIII [Halomonas llamarensis]|uniref:DNA-(apurinic or apyrimidinic site) lyase n=1 Tax=Halomonas llamarensis TaxID=2945104 RepID=A0ABT0SR94_9GAMM|nr:endonuclease VIII [Halomonas llamarensis]MCL7930342.1 endonuclease VIII [Halomonas llamarensis]
MPEGPEIRRAADRIEKQLLGGPIEDAWFAFDELKPHAASLIGVSVRCVDTRGKAMLIRFTDQRVLYSHNQLYGVWKYHRATTEPATHRSLRARLVVQGRAASLYSASDISMWDADSLQQHPFLARLGPDVLSQPVNINTVTERLTLPAFHRRGLGGLLLDQSFIAGLGNYLRSEILFFAALHPKCRPYDLGNAQIQRLAQHIVDVTWQAYRQAGVTNTEDWIKKAKELGEARRQWRFAVFARVGLPCHRCATSIERIKVGSRRLYLCPRCQRNA